MVDELDTLRTEKFDLQDKNEKMSKKIKQHEYDIEWLTNQMIDK